MLNWAGGLGKKGGEKKSWRSSATTGFGILRGGGAKVGEFAVSNTTLDPEDGEIVEEVFDEIFDAGAFFVGDFSGG